MGLHPVRASPRSNLPLPPVSDAQDKTTNRDSPYLFSMTSVTCISTRHSHTSAHKPSVIFSALHEQHYAFYSADRNHSSRLIESDSVAASFTHLSAHKPTHNHPLRPQPQQTTPHERTTSSSQHSTHPQRQNKIT